MSTHTATAAREGRWWVVTVDEPDVVTQARRLADAEQTAREAVAVTLDVPLDDVAVTVRVAAVGDVVVTDALDVIDRDRAEAQRLEREASQRAVALARGLAAADVPLRDIGTILGVAHQRAHQLVTTTLA